MTKSVAGAAIALAIGLATVFAFHSPAVQAQHAPCNPAVQVC